MIRGRKHAGTWWDLGAVVVVVAALAIGACAAQTRNQALITTGDTLRELVPVFEAVSRSVDAGCRAQPRQLSQTFCVQYADVQTSFKKYHPVAVSAWNTAVASNDVLSQAQAAAAIRALAASINGYSAQLSPPGPTVPVAK